MARVLKLGTLLRLKREAQNTEFGYIMACIFHFTDFSFRSNLLDLVRTVL